METTLRHALPSIAASQSQKHVTHNEALDKIDRLIGLRILSRSLAVPPAAPAEGDCFAVPLLPTGIWAGQSGHLATWDGAAWAFDTPATGLQAFVQDEGTVLVFDGATWRALHGNTDRFDRLGLGVAPHASSPLMVEGEEAIFTGAPTGSVSESCRLFVNKTSAAATASLIFQSSWQGKAELGLLATDHFGLKVGDSAQWRTALSVNHLNGNVSVPYSLVVGEGPGGADGLTISRPAPRITFRDTVGVGVSHLSFMSFVDKNGAEKAWCGLGSSTNTEFTFLSHYPDGITFYTFGGNNPIQFVQGGQKRLKVHTNGFIGVQENAPTAPLHVNGGVRVGTYSKAQLPSATGLGAGTIIFVTDDTVGATLAFSDGAAWLRAHDRQPVA